VTHADEEVRRLREELKEAEEAADEAQEARDEAEEAQEGAEEAQAGAQEARVGAEGAKHGAEDAQREAARSARSADRHRLTAEERSKEFLRDRLPDEERTNSYGRPGRPLKRHSAFYMGFTGAAGALLAFWIGQQILSIRGLLVLIVVALFLAVGLNPLVEVGLRRGLKRPVSVALVVTTVLGVLTVFVVAVVPMVTAQVTTITEEAPRWFDQIRSNPTIADLNQRYGLVDRAQQMMEGGRWARVAFGGALGLGLAVLSAIANTVIVVVLTLYFLASLPSIKRFGYRFAPASRRERVTYLGDQILANIGGYVAGAFVVALTAGVTTLVFLLVIGLGEYAVALAVVVALLDVIPMIGATLGAVVVTAVGFATDPRIGLACLAFYVGYQLLENYLIYPRVMSRSVDIPGSLIVVAALIGAGLLGVVGALLAIPAAAAVQLIVKEVLLRRQEVS
jgi:predicted PurR-regulated permease PerM